MITEILVVIGQALGLINKRTDLKNAADVQQGAKAASEAAEREKDIKATNDIEEERKRSAE